MKITAGPWVWIRFKTDPNEPFLCALESETDRSKGAILYMREDFAQFPYAGDLPDHHAIAAVPDMIKALYAARHALRCISQSIRDNSSELSLINAALAKAEKRGNLEPY